MRTVFIRFLAIASATTCACLAGPLAQAEQPFSFEQAYGRLPKDVVPQGYEIDITPDAAALAIAGHERVELEFRSATATIQFNSLNQKLGDVTLDGKPVKSVASDDSKQLTTITLESPAAKGRHRLAFSYTGKIEAQPHGLFLQHYVDPKGAKGMMLSTQMESTDARRMFPCWDEPAFRATFRLQVTVPAEWAVTSNMPVATRSVQGPLATTTFGTTPKMPSYLVEFSAGDLAHIDASAGGTAFSVWAVRGQEGGGQVALANAQQILADYNDYFGLRFPLPKLDSIAVPGGFSGAMENWGAITYNDRLLLVTPQSTVGDRQQVYSVQAHEMAHQWFGDLVTMGWWDDIWLNESFASWMAAKQTDRRNPDWHWWLGQDADKEGAMAADGIAAAHAIQQHVTDELQVDNAFDPQITYSKGQAILRMLEAWLGPDTFRDGVRRYMQARAYSNATSADLWNALGAAGKRDVGAVAAGWTEQPGYPLVSVTAHCDAAGARTIDLAQHRFLRGSGPEAAASGWAIPLQLRSGTRGEPRPFLLTKDARGVAAGRCDEPLSVNANAIGYFRARYDTPSLATNTRGFGALPEGDRVALLDDQWALVSAGTEPLGSYLALASAPGGGLVPRAWEQIAGSLGTIEFNERGTPGHEAFTAYARSLLAPVYAQLGNAPKAGETPDLQHLRRVIYGELGLWGDAAVLADARRRFAAFLADHKALAPDDQGTVLGIVAHFADAATFEQLHALAKGTHDPSELPRYYSALMSVADPGLARQAAAIALSDELPPQAKSLPLGLVAQLANQHPQLAWQTFTSHTEQLLAAQPSMAGLIVAQYMPQIFWAGVPLAEIEAFARAHVPAEMGPVVERGMETARFQLQRKGALVREADAFLKN